MIYISIADHILRHFSMKNVETNFMNKGGPKTFQFNLILIIIF